MPEMKYSGVEWIGEVPENWNLMTIGSLFHVRNEKVSDTEYAPLSVSRGGVVPQMENVAKTDANDNRKLVLKNDFAINSRSDRKQSCGVSPLDGSVSLINTVLYAAPTAPMVTEYPNILMKNYGFAEEFYRWGHGIVADLWTTRWQEMKSILLPIPSEDEQRRIIDKVVIETQKIANLIANQEAQIEKLKAYKQSLITEVVTKGLDSTVPMKDSGVEWIGEIPENWKVAKLSWISKLSSGATPDRTHPEYWDGDINWVKTGELQNGELYESKEKITQEGIDNSSTQIYDVNTILVAMYGQGKTRGMTALLKTRCATNQACAAVQIVSPQVMTDFVWKALIGAYNGMREMALGSGQPNLSLSMLSGFKIPVPQLNEQKAIVDFLNEEIPKVDRLIAIKQAKIEKLNEYKKSLIYEYVTGKKEVI